MADQLKDSLMKTITQLEDRVRELERKLEGKTSSSVEDGMRMILIGPPGAGRSSSRALLCANH